MVSPYVDAQFNIVVSTTAPRLDTFMYFFYSEAFSWFLYIFYLLRVKARDSSTTFLFSFQEIIKVSLKSVYLIGFPQSTDIVWTKN